MMPEPLLVPFTDKGKEVSTGLVLGFDTRTKTEQVDHSGTNGDRSCDWCQWHRMYCIWPPEGVCQKSCDQCVAQKIPCVVDGIQVSNQKRWDRLETGGLWRWKKSWVEVESDVESEWSGLGGRRDWDWRQEVSFTLVGIQGLLREQNGLLRKIAQSLDRGSKASSEEVEDSTIRE